MTDKKSKREIKLGKSKSLNNLTNKHDKKVNKNKLQTYSRSRSKSQSKTRSNSRSNSRSKTQSKSRSKARSKSRSKARSMMNLRNVKSNKQIGGGDSEICKRDINDLLTTNKKIYTYNNSGSGDGKSFTQQANALGSSVTSDWGSNPGPPPDPSGCIIL